MAWKCLVTCPKSGFQHYKCVSFSPWRYRNVFGSCSAQSQPLWLHWRTCCTPYKRILSLGPRTPYLLKQKKRKTQQVLKHWLTVTTKNYRSDHINESNLTNRVVGVEWRERGVVNGRRCCIYFLLHSLGIALWFVRSRCDVSVGIRHLLRLVLLLLAMQTVYFRVLLSFCSRHWAVWGAFPFFRKCCDRGTDRTPTSGF